MEAVQVISTTTIKAPPSQENETSPQKIDLTPWDLQFLLIETIQKGILFRKEEDPENQIRHLQHSLSSTLAFFPPLAGRLAILQHHDDDNNNNNNTVSSHIVCNNDGVLFVHAVAPHTSLADILQPKYVPRVVHSFFALNGVKNYQATSQPLLAVQVTELLDAVFIAFTINHVVADGKSFWHFVNSWAEISRGSPQISKLPSLQRFFPHGIDCAIRFPFTEPENENEIPEAPLPERVFHITKQKIWDLKSKANKDTNTERTISSLQAVLTLLWRMVVRHQRFGAEEEVHYVFLVGARPRMVPPLPEDYFGNAALMGRVTMKAGELLSEGGFGKGALEMNKMISLQSHEKIKNHYECWVESPRLLTIGSAASRNSLATSSSPRFDIYGNDFGWGKPIAVRSGAANKSNGKISVFAGSQEGSIDVQVCLPYEILEAIGNDPEFMDATFN